MTSVVFIQARMGSTRLPGKVLADLVGMPVLWHVIRRVKYASRPDEILVATTVNPEDDVIEPVCKQWGVKIWRGDSDDVLKRFYDGLMFLERCNKKIDYIVRVTADCPLICPELVDRAIGIAISGRYDYVSNIDPPSYPDGLDIEVISRQALIDAYENALLPSEREHVTPYIRNNPSIFKYNIRDSEDRSELRWTLDTENDLMFIQRIYADLYSPSELFTTSDVLNYLINNPEVRKINEHIRRNEGYAKSLEAEKLILKAIK